MLVSSNKKILFLNIKLFWQEEYTVNGIIIGRYINGITLNPLEYVLDDDGELMVFATEDKAKDFLREHGFDDEDMEYLVFEEVCDENDEEKEFYKDLLMEQQEQM